MAKARNIKPGLYFDEELAECSLAARYLFTGLWCIADREGRLEDRPKRIKAEIFPYDSYNIDKLLYELFQSGHIIRYEVDSKQYIQVVNFVKHQTPDKNEKPSEIPACDTTPEVSRDYSSTPVITRDYSSTPDSPTLIINSFHSCCPSLGRVTKLTDKRKKTITTRLKEYPSRQLEKAFKLAESSSFLTGGNDRGWKADFDWILNENNLVKILEGKYESKGAIAAGSLQDAIECKQAYLNQDVTCAYWRKGEKKYDYCVHCSWENRDTQGADLPERTQQQKH